MIELYRPIKVIMNKILLKSIYKIKLISRENIINKIKTANK